jgi:Cutinase
MGSGEAKNSKGQPLLKASQVDTTNQSYSPETKAVYQALTAKLQDEHLKITPQFYQLPYLPPSTETLTKGLFSGLTVSPSKLTSDVATVWDRLVTRVPDYIAGELTGESALYKKLTQIQSACSAAGVQSAVVLAGYSQGAMVIHNVLNTLAASGPASLASMIKGAVLVADPERMPNSAVLNFGTAPVGDYGLCHLADLVSAGVATLTDAYPSAKAQPNVSCVAPDKTTDVSESFATISYQVCDTDDLVCDTSGLASELESVLRVPFSRAQASEEWNTLVTDLQTSEKVHTQRYTTAAVFSKLAGDLVNGLGRAQAVPTSPPTSSPSTSGATGAIEVPGTAAASQVASVSCASPGNCAAGGYYTDSSLNTRAFVADEVNGTWQNAVEVPGTEALSADVAEVTSMSCASAGNCTAGGYYNVASQVPGCCKEAFVAAEVNGTWQNAIEVPGTAALNTGTEGMPGGAQVTSVSCATAGNCAIGGYYTDSSDWAQPFVADEVNGTWQNAVEVPGTAALGTTTSDAQSTSVSCASPGNCAVGGYYTDPSDYEQAFVADEVNGTWQSAVEIPGTAALNTGGEALVGSVSCASAGNCTIGGSYSDGPYRTQAFVADEVKGTWQNAVEVPGTAALNTGNIAAARSVSCASAGNCTVGGYYADSPSGAQAFVANEVNGTWQTAVEVPGTAGLDAGDTAQVASVSCASAGNCTVGGLYYDSAYHEQVFVADEVNGTWENAVEVPGTAALNTGGGAEVTSVSCASAGNCTLGGHYSDSTPNWRAFVADEIGGN